jgi:hypothetical protein
MPVKRTSSYKYRYNKIKPKIDGKTYIAKSSI